MLAHAVSSPIAGLAKRLCAIVGAVSIAVLAGCAAPGPKGLVAPPVPPQPPAPHQLSADQPDFLRLPNLAPDKTPLRVGVILPFSNPSAGTRALANAMLKAAELALYDSANHDIVLMTADASGTSRRSQTPTGRLRTRRLSSAGIP